MALQRLNTLSLTFGKALEANLRSGDISFELPAEKLLTEVLSKVVGKDPELLIHDGSPESLGMFTSAGAGI